MLRARVTSVPGRPPRLAVVGSLNLDIIAQVARLPAPGETVPGTKLLRRFGGKGANQAVAAARQGAAVSLIGCVGDDADGAAYVARLAAEGIDPAGLHRTTLAPTGTALIGIDARGENAIICTAGANGRLGAAQVRAQHARIADADLLLVQWEIPRPALLAAIRIANRAGVPVLMNPSPWREDFPWGRVRIDTLVVNAAEARALFGRAAENPAALAIRLAACGVSRLAVTAGAAPTLLVAGGHSVAVPTLPVVPIDTVGAGDTFAGVLAAQLAGGADFAAAARHANVAGALATLKRGAQEGMPSRPAVLRALRRFAPARDRAA